MEEPEPDIPVPNSPQATDSGENSNNEPRPELEPEATDSGSSAAPAPPQNTPYPDDERTDPEVPDGFDENVYAIIKITGKMPAVLSGYSPVYVADNGEAYYKIPRDDAEVLRYD